MVRWQQYDAEAAVHRTAQRHNARLRPRALVCLATACVVVLYYTIPGRRDDGWEVGIGSAPPPPDANERPWWLGSSSTASGASRWDYLDWMPPRSRSDAHRDFQWREETVAWRERERGQLCGIPEADAEVAAGVDEMYRHVSLAYVNPVKDTSVALRRFRKAADLAPNCTSAKLNWCIVQLPLANDAEAYRKCSVLLAGVDAQDRLRAKALLHRGFNEELLGHGETAHNVYLTAFRADPRLSMIYFGKPAEYWGAKKVPVTFFADRRMSHPGGRKVQLLTLRKLIVYAEFGQHFGGYTHYTKEEAQQFLDVWYTMVRDLLPPYVVSVLKECYRNYVALGAIKFNDIQSKRWYHYNDPVVRYISASVNGLISNIVDQPTKTSYTYMGVYPGGSQLPPHVDRAACEWTMSVSVDVNPTSEVCPIGVRKQPKKLSKEKSYGKNVKPDDPSQMVYVHPHIGDAVLFRGRGMVHWRDPIPEHMNCTNLFLHFVRVDFDGKDG